MTILSIAVVFLAGIVFFASPCCLPMVPAYVSYIVGTTPADSPNARRVAFKQSRLDAQATGQEPAREIRRRPSTGRPTTMNTDIPGHNHDGKNHLLGMLGIGALVLVVLLAAGSSFRTALPFAALLACPLMMGAMMFMMMRGGNGRQQGDDAPNQRDHNGVTDHRTHDVPETWQDSPNITPPQSPPTTTRP